MTPEELRGKRRRWELEATFTQMDIKQLFDEIERLQKENEKLNGDCYNYKESWLSWQEEANAQMKENERYRYALEQIDKLNQICFLQDTVDDALNQAGIIVRKALRGEELPPGSKAALRNR